MCQQVLTAANRRPTKSERLTTRLLLGGNCPLYLTKVPNAKVYQSERLCNLVALKQVNCRIKIFRLSEGQTICFIKTTTHRLECYIQRLDNDAVIRVKLGVTGL